MTAGNTRDLMTLINTEEWVKAGCGWHWLQYTGVPVKVPPEVWQMTANGYWCRSTQPKGRSRLDLIANGWVYLAPIPEPAP